jgi:hypothetical protein
VELWLGNTALEYAEASFLKTSNNGIFFTISEIAR